VEKLVVDEASQINAFDFVVWIHPPGPPRIFLITSQHIFHKSLEQVYFIGDPLQCTSPGVSSIDVQLMFESSASVWPRPSISTEEHFRFRTSPTPHRISRHAVYEPY
jgi:hypothetical protein